MEQFNSNTNEKNDSEKSLEDKLMIQEKVEDEA